MTLLFLIHTNSLYVYVSLSKTLVSDCTIAVTWKLHENNLLALPKIMRFDVDLNVHGKSTNWFSFNLYKQYQPRKHFDQTHEHDKLIVGIQVLKGEIDFNVIGLIGDHYYDS